MKIKIEKLRLLGKTTNQIVVNDYYIFTLTLKKHRLFYSSGKKPERITLTAKRLGYTTKGVISEVFSKKKQTTD